MPNPMEAFANSFCDICGDSIPEGEEIYFHNNEKYCRDCADNENIVCDCGNYKKPEFDVCYSCYQEE